MEYLKFLLIQLVWLLSEFEALFARPNDRIFIRRLYLQLMRVKYKKSIWIGKSFHLLNPDNLDLGECCALGAFVRIENHAKVRIGDNFLAAPGLVINSGTHEHESLIPMGLDINIGSNVWCGEGVTIIAGVTIGDNVMIGANSLVCKDIPDNTIAAGVPAKKLRQLHREGVKLWTWSKGEN